MRRNADARNFRLVGPDETASNRLGDVLEVTDRAWMAARTPADEGLAPRRPGDGDPLGARLRGLARGVPADRSARPVLAATRRSSTSSIRCSTSTRSGSKVSRGIPWRRPVASLNYLLTSHVWRQDHNGFSHQDPGFIDHVVNKRAEVVRVYLPPDANTLLAVGDHCLAPRLRQRRSSPASSPRRMADAGGRRSATARAARHLGMGLERRRRAGGRDGLRRRRPDAGDSRRRQHPARRSSPS